MSNSSKSQESCYCHSPHGEKKKPDILKTESKNIFSRRTLTDRSTFQTSPILDNSFPNARNNGTDTPDLNISRYTQGSTNSESSQFQNISTSSSKTINYFDQSCSEQQNDDSRSRENKSEDEESEKEKIARENEESEALARILMAEEALASYTMSSNFMEENAGNYASEDLAALQAALDEDEFSENVVELDPDDDTSLSYDALLSLGERIGDVKEERWKHVANSIIDKMQVSTFCKSNTCAGQNNINDCVDKCLICQFPYEENDILRHLPCKHMFHAKCVDKWLQNKDFCPYCRQSVAP